MLSLMSTQEARGPGRSREKHRRILDAAAAQVARVGYPAATIEGVAAAAGVGKQTIYRWWPSKAALYVEVYAGLVSREALVTGIGTGEAALVELLRRLFRIYRDTPAGRILAGLVADAAADEDARVAVCGGLVTGRSEIVRDVAATSPQAAEVVNEVIVATVWKRLVTDPGSLDDAFAAHLVRTALGAAGVRS